jgi:hypothetical protein
VIDSTTHSEKKLMKTEVWLSLMLQDVELIKLISPDRAFQTRVYENGSRGNFHAWGKTIENQVDIPTEVYGRYHDKTIRKLPDLVNCGGYMCVSARLKSILSEFDLSGATFHPVKCFEFDGVTPISGEFYFLNFGRQFDAVIPEKSKGLKKPYNEREVYFVKARAYDDVKTPVACLRSEALPQKDLWSDPKVHEVIFLSNRLAERLKKEKLHKLFKLRACDVVDVG